MKEEITNRIIQLLNEEKIDGYMFKQKLLIVLNDYQITRQTTELALPMREQNESIFQKFLLSKVVNGMAERTIKYYGTQLAFIFNRINKSCLETTADDIRYYLAVRQAQDKISKTTACNESRVLSSFYDWLLKEDYIAKNPMNRVGIIKQPKIKKEAFTDLEIEKLRGACRNEKEKAIVEIFLSTGCRVSELVNIRLDEINGDTVLVHGKGSKDRYVYLNAKALYAIQKYIAKRTDKNPYLFPRMKSIAELPSNITRANRIDLFAKREFVQDDGHCRIDSIGQMCRKLAKRGGVEQANPHKFRRTCATLALRHGMPVEQVSQMLGHESIATTQIYLDLSEDDLAAAHRRYVV